MRIHATFGVLLIGLTGAGCTPTLVNYAPRVHVVQSGETLMYIAWRHQVDSRDLARWNDLENPDLILIGQRLNLTPPASSAPARSDQASSAQTPSGPAPVAAAAPAAATAVPPVPSPSGSSRTRSTPRASGQAGPPAASSGQSVSPAAAAAAGRPLPSLPVLPAPPWQWPVRGPVVSAYGASEGTGSGIGIGGTLGADIKATAQGQVVYAGGGLAAYGNLVILKHNDTYLSAYGHNDELVVSEGDEVTQGQVIAKMGLGPERQAQVHFEIRRNGTPADPLGLLPN